MTTTYIKTWEEPTNIETRLLSQLKRVRAMEKSPIHELISTLKSISQEFVRKKDATIVGIRMFYSDNFSLLTDDSKTVVVEKTIEHLKHVMESRNLNIPTGFDDPDYSWHSRFFPRVEVLIYRLIRSRSYELTRSLQREFLDLVLDSIAAAEGLTRYSIKHPQWTRGARTYAVVVSKPHYEDAHSLSKLYGFRSCAVMMSFALTEYQEFLKKEVGNYAI